MAAVISPEEPPFVRDHESFSLNFSISERRRTRREKRALPVSGDTEEKRRRKANARNDGRVFFSLIDSENVLIIKMN